MKYQFLSRDVLKLVAILSMLIDHVGKIFFPSILAFQIIGRLAFPIFAFFIAEGFYFTKNKIKYFLTIFIFALIAQIPYGFLWNGLNVLFTFCCSLILMFFWKLSMQSSLFEKIILKFIFFCLVVAFICLGFLFDLDYRWYGILLPVSFYILRSGNVVKMIAFFVLTVLFVIENLCWSADLSFYSFIQLFALLSIFLLIAYNQSLRSNKKLKYMFYVFYPLHLLVLLLITLI